MERSVGNACSEEWIKVAQTLLIPAYFFGDIHYYVNIIQHDNVIIDLHENYVKQTQRNHTRIIGPNGSQKISIPVSFSSSQKTQTKEVTVCLKAPEAKQHIQSITTAYGSSPFFESFTPYLTELFARSYANLEELNKASLQIICSILEIDHIRYANEYVSDVKDMIDLRSAKKQEFTFPSYPQVFSKKHGFVENLSILDLIFNEGRWAREYLKNISLHSL